LLFDPIRGALVFDKRLEFAGEVVHLVDLTCLLQVGVRLLGGTGMAVGTDLIAGASLGNLAGDGWMLLRVVRVIDHCGAIWVI